LRVDINPFIIDEPIRKIVILLNRNGVLTSSSCSGHYERQMMQTIITFNIYYSIPEIKDLINVFIQNGWNYYEKHQRIEKVAKTELELSKNIEEFNFICYSFLDKLKRD